MDSMQEFRDLYVQTARERIQALNDLLLKLEANPEQLDLVEELMRTGHSLKGESGAMGFEQIATLAHVIEDLFSAIGNGQLEANSEIIDALLEGIDNIQASVNQISSAPDAVDIDSSACVNKIKELTGLKTEGFGKSQPGAKVEADKALKKEAKAEEKTEAPAEETPTSAASNQKSPGSDQKISTVTLKVEKLDKMVNISEELVLMKMKLKNSPLLDNNTQLKADIHRLDRLVTDMQFHIMQTRLFPISLAFQTLPRLVRDVSKKTNKKVQLVLEGEESTVDKGIIDHLTEPFVHMIRNGVDHGIETAEERITAGKPEQATIKLSAYTKENKFYIDIADDGRGIEWDKLTEVSIKKGVVEAEEVATWSDEQKQKLLFMDGLSTSEEVTDVSGRGVGMSAVQRAIRKLGGDIVVKTKVGEGTTFTLRLPLTLAIMQALLVKVAKQVYAIPSSQVLRSIQVDAQSIQSSANIPVIVVDQQKVNLIDLNTVFIRAEGENDESEAGDDPALRTVVLIKTESGMMGYIVNKIVDEEEVLVKPLGPLLKKQSKHFSGATILADGTAAPIINTEKLS